MAKPKNDPEISAAPATPTATPTPTQEEPAAVPIPEEPEVTQSDPEAVEQLPATALPPFFTPSGPGRAVQLAARCPPDEVRAVAATVNVDPRRVYAWRDYPDGIVVITTNGQRVAGAVR